VRVVDYEGDGDVLGGELGESPLWEFSYWVHIGGMKAYQVDDLVVAGRQDITPIVVEGLTGSVVGQQVFRRRQDLQHSASRTSGSRRRGCRRRAASREQPPGSIS
jgi:hypothetical protein